jgi:hypothetical protein
LILPNVNGPSPFPHHSGVNFRNRPVGLIFVLIVFLLNCGEDANPVIDNSGTIDAPWKSIRFLPKRKFLTADSAVPVLLEGLNKGFTCSKVECINIQILADTIRPSVTVRLPAKIDACPLVPEKGLDTIIKLDLNRWNSLPRMIFLKSVTGKTDSLWLTGKPPYLIDSALALDNGLDSAAISDSLIPDSLELNCGNTISFAFYCISKDPDSLFYRASVQEDLDTATCDTLELKRVEKQYWHRLVQDTSTTCRQILEDTLRAYLALP